MSFKERLKLWNKNLNKHKVKYKDGFFHLSNNSNSPESMVESFDSLPFVKHDKNKKLFYANTFFLKVTNNYLEIENGLWIMLSDIYFKRNVVMNNIFEEGEQPNYHFINLHYNQKSLVSKSMLINGMLLTNKTWTVFKAGKVTKDYHFKGSNEKNITIYFTTEWIKNLFTKNYSDSKYNFEKFFDSKSEYILLPDSNQNSDNFYEMFSKKLTEKNKVKSADLVEIVEEFFDYFIHLFESEIITEEHFNLTDKDRKSIQKIEKYLLDNLFKPFPGIDFLADLAGVSPTKLKNDFKIIHNQGLFQYYRTYQMHLAKKLLSEKEQPIKDVAQLLGYENASKFSAAFKNQFGLNPSSLQN